MKVAAIQMVSGISLDANLSAARALLDQAARAGAELAVLPEYFCFMGQQDADKLLLAEQPGLGTVQDFLSDAAREFKLWIVGGTMPMATDDPTHAANASLVYDHKGHCVSRYDKIHLFRYDNGREAYDESAVLTAGETPVVFDFPTRHGEQILQPARRCIMIGGSRYGGSGPEGLLGNVHDDFYLWTSF